ncbi:MAG: winged helix-turn-helix domain-containing protein [Archaeoglobales archaeon]|nr:winged helix-turn-helix domain-containing protein [Archaeoglobales archaeon]
MLEVLAPEKRRCILFAIKKRPMDLKTVSTALNIPPPVALKHLKKLEESKLIEKNGKTYRLTYLGDLTSTALENFVNFVEFIKKDIEYWASHDLSCLPENFKLRLPEIGKYELIKSYGEEVLRHFKIFSEIYKNSKKVRALSAVMFPPHPRMFAEIATRSDVEVIITNKMLKNLEEYYQEELEKYIKAGGKIFICDDVKITIITTERALCMGFFFRDGVYDTESGLLSYDKSAINWGFEVFEYFKAKSKKF